MPGKKAIARLDGAEKTATATPGQVRALRLRAQQLCPKASVDDLIAVVRSLGGVNAQSGPAMMLSLRARMKGLEPDDVRKALAQGRLVRTWAMRGTIHLIDSDDLGWLVSLLGPAILPKGRGRRLELGLDEDAIGRDLEAIKDVLDGEKPLTRDELVAGLIDRGIPLERKSQAPYHLIVYAALKGLVCLGPDRENGDQTYCLAERWIGKRKPWTGDDALAGLVTRYLCGYGPASLKDFSSWSGLSLASAKKGWDLVSNREVLRSITVENGVLWSPGSQLTLPEEPAGTGTIVNLLPAFDAFVLGYADREYLVPEKWRKEVYHGGQTVPVVLVNGQTAGVWRYERQGKKLAVAVHPFGPLDSVSRDLVAAEAEDIGRFFGLPAVLAWR